MDQTFSNLPLEYLNSTAKCMPCPEREILWNSSMESRKIIRDLTRALRSPRTLMFAASCCLGYGLISPADGIMGWLLLGATVALTVAAVTQLADKLWRRFGQKFPRASLVAMALLPIAAVSIVFAKNLLR